MRLETFFEKFEQFADASGAVGRMRELVLHLAVTGKLVEQTMSDEAGEVLLKKINAERLSAVKARQIRAMKPVPSVSADHLSFELQTGWVAAPLMELVMEIKTGPFGSALHKSDYKLGGTPVINPASLKDGKIIPVDQMAVGSATLKRLEVFKIHAGDIVMARRGEMGRCAVVTKSEEGWLCGTGSLVLRMPRSMHAPFLAMLIGSTMARIYLGGASVGTTMQNLNQSILAKMPVGVPPLAEQKRIVAKVDELMALCDRLEAQQQERDTRQAALARAALARFADATTPANLELLFYPPIPKNSSFIPQPSFFLVLPADLRKSILTLAVQGKLVHQDSNDEPAQVLLNRLDNFRLNLLESDYPNTSESKVQIKKQAKQRKPSDLNKPPSGWQWATLMGASILVVDCHNKTAPYSRDGIPLIRTTNIRGGELNSKEPKFVTEETYERWAARTYPEPGDILITREAPMGEACIIPEDLRICMGQRMMLIRLNPDFVDPQFILLTIQAPCMMGRVQDKPVGATVQHLRVGGVETMLVPLPPLAEQRRIVAKVDQLMALVDELETQLAASRATAKNLLEALVAELTAAG